ncbi:MAG: substrate-binding domain-containing protein [Magnetospiraceae bacterium]
MSDYLTTKELADLLRIKERKVYDLASSGDIPCVKVTGKLLFPARDVDAWIADSRFGPLVGRSLPKVFLGSHDPLLDWALRESRCGLATFFDGSHDGIGRFISGEGLATGLHVRDAAGDWNIPEVARKCSDMDAVLIGFARRRRGLVTLPGSALTSLPDLVGRTVIRRQPESGAEPLFLQLLTEAGLDPETIHRTDAVRNESDAALAILRGDADAAFGLEALAVQYRLGFTPLIEESFDLLVDRRAYFDAPFQAFLDFCRSDTFLAVAARYQGYDTAPLGKVRWNAS